MSISFEPVTTIKVKHDGKLAGTIKEVNGGWAYFPKGCSAKNCGDTFATLSAVMHSVKG